MRARGSPACVVTARTEWRSHISLPTARWPTLNRASESYWQTSRFRIDVTVPRVMGIVNLTPDSFSGDGLSANPAAALAHCERLLVDGADILDLGAESTRPGAAAVDAATEWARLSPVLQAVVGFGCPVSVDTQKATVMRHALDAGADIVNDVRALRGPGTLEVVAAHPLCGVCLMHMQGEPVSMQSDPAYADVVSEVIGFLAARGDALQRLGVARERLVFDPGIGFGKSAAHNLALLRRQPELLALGRPLLVGWSRKSTLGTVTGRPPGLREAASVTAALASVQQGARIVRVHDVAATTDALKVWRAAGLGV